MAVTMTGTSGTCVGRRVGSEPSAVEVAGALEVLAVAKASDDGPNGFAFVGVPCIPGCFNHGTKPGSTGLMGVPGAV